MKARTQITPLKMLDDKRHKNDGGKITNLYLLQQKPH